MSAIATRPAPPPIAAPCTRAMIGIGETVELAEEVGQRAGVLEVLIKRVVGHRAHPGEVSAGAERISLAPEHDTASIARHRIDGHTELRDELRVERVLHFGARQGDAGDPPLVDREARQLCHRSTTRSR